MAIKTVIGALRAGARFVVEAAAKAGIYGAAQVSVLLKRYPSMGREAASDLSKRIMGDIMTARKTLRAGEATKIPRAAVPVQPGLTQPYRAVAQVTITDPNSGMQKTLTVRPGFQRNPTAGQIQQEAIGLVMDIVRQSDTPTLRGLVQGVATWTVDLVRLARRSY